MTVLVDRIVLATSGKTEAPRTLDLAPGTHGVCLPPAAAAPLARVMAGLERAKRGRVTIGGEDPFGKPALRARLGCTVGRSFSPYGRETAQAFWDRVRVLRAQHGGVTVEPVGLLPPERLAVPLDQLSLQEIADFELELALCIESPPLVWLHEPPRLGAQVSLVLERLRQRALGGAVVVVTASTAREASVWADRVHRLAPTRPEAPAITLQLVVERPREIAAELQSEAAVTRTTLDPTRPKLVLVSGSDELELQKACARAVVARRCELWEMVSLRGAVGTSGSSPSAGGGA